MPWIPRSNTRMAARTGIYAKSRNPGQSIKHRKLAKSWNPWYSEQLLEFGIQYMVPESEPFLLNH